MIDDKSSVFFVRCVGYTQCTERFFSVGQEYEVKNGHITSDTGFTYFDHAMTPNSDPKIWYLSDWYEFEIVGSEPTIAHCDVSIDDILGIK